MAAVRGGDAVGDAQHGRGADGGAFLADGDVRGAAIGVALQWLVATRTQPDDHLLQFADRQHVVEQVHGRGAIDVMAAHLVGQIAIVLEAPDLRRCDGKGLELRSVVGAVERAGIGHRSSSGDQDADAGVCERGGGLLVKLGVGDDDVELIETAGVGE